MEVFQRLESPPLDAAARLATMAHVKGQLADLPGPEAKLLLELMDREADLVTRSLPLSHPFHLQKRTFCLDRQIGHDVII